MSSKNHNSLLAKFKKSSTRTKVLLAAFVVVFAGLGIFQIVNSGAAATGYGVVSVQVVEMDAAGQLTGKNVPGATVTIAPNPAAATYTCTQNSAPVGTGTSGTSGIAPFTCATYSGTGKQYTANASKTGYTSKGSYTSTVLIGQSNIFRVVLQQNQAAQPCPTGYTGTYPNCVAPPPSGLVGNILIHIDGVAADGTTLIGGVSGIEVSLASNDPAYYCTGQNNTRANTVKYTTDAAGNAYFQVCNTPGVAGLTKEYQWSFSPPSGYIGGPTSGGFDIVSTTITGKVQLAPGQQQKVTQKVQKTSVATDTTAPSAPSALTATAIGGGQITLNWNGSTDNVGVVSYKIKLANWGTVATVNAPLHTVTTNSATPGSSYTYTVIAVDAAGNNSSASNSVTVIAK